MNLVNFVTTDDGKLDMLTIKTILFGRIELIQFIIPFDAVIDGVILVNIALHYTINKNREYNTRPGLGTSDLPVKSPVS